ncbi:metastasis-suppressor KiSS-1 [Anguilla rostrata]|uniref:metastasis-suppressor KiSS-1 n=1 Tax=Anguilla rostrata TaxID=7938 RepID=UPI0030D25082
MTDMLWARSAPAPFSHATILLLTVVSMVTVRFGETRSLRYTPYTADEDPEIAAMRVLRQMNEELSTEAPPSPHRPAHWPTALANPLPGGAGLPRRSWWWYPEVPPQQAKKRENFSSYNWNSFGLRYGK